MIKERLPTPGSDAEAEYDRMVLLMNGLIDRVGDVETHPLAGLLDLVGALVSGLEGGQVMPSKQGVSPVEAAYFLNVSLAFVIKEISAGRLPHRMAGQTQCIAFKDLLVYEKKMRLQQSEALDRLAEESQRLGLDY